MNSAKMIGIVDSKALSDSDLVPQEKLYILFYISNRNPSVDGLAVFFSFRAKRIRGSINNL